MNFYVKYLFGWLLLLSIIEAIAFVTNNNWRLRIRTHIRIWQLAVSALLIYAYTSFDERQTTQSFVMLLSPFFSLLPITYYSGKFFNSK